MPLLDIYAGKHALAHIRERGLAPEDIRVILGASGGPKWFVLSHLDRYLVSQWLPQINHELDLVGSSIGAWRMSAYASGDPLGAIERLEQHYLEQQYSDKPDAREITDKLHQLIDAFVDQQDALSSSKRNLHIVAARAKGITRFEPKLLQTLAFGSVALANALSRKSLPIWFERVIFQSNFHAEHSQLPVSQWDQFTTHQAALSKTNLRQALHASGAIPVVIEGVKNPHGAPAGMYRDGGMVDYHFDLPIKPDNGLVLYPHFSPVLKPGWFDKSLPWRKVSADNYSHTVVVCPSREFIATLPGGKITDRKDFTRFETQERIRRWREVVEKNRLLADEFDQLTQTNQIRQAAQPIEKLLGESA